jgi:zinc and cadmium transporter
LSSLLVRGGEYSSKKILISMFIFALATPLGAVFTLLLFQGMTAYTVAIALGVSAGTFLFISTTDLLPTVYEEHESREYKNLVSLCLGILVMILSKGIV